MRFQLPVMRMVGCLGLLLMAFSPAQVMADGTHTLGPPVGLTIESGSGIVVAGTGMLTQPGTIMIDIPAGAVIKQALLYWEGYTSTLVPGDDTITVNGTSITGTLIGGPANFFAGAFSSSFRADITQSGLIVPGTNSLTLSDMEFDVDNNGASVLVIIDDGSGSALIDIRDGDDTAFYIFDAPLDTTVPQLFTFDPASAGRTAELALFAGSVGEGRPNIVEVTVDGVTTEYVNVFEDNDGPEWDSVVLAVDIPAGATELSVQALSKSDGSGRLPASIVWIGAGLSLPSPEEAVCGLEITKTASPNIITLEKTDTQRFTKKCRLHERTGKPYDRTWSRLTEETELSGTLVTYTYVVSNNGNALSNVMVVDDKLGNIAGPIELAAGESRTFTTTTEISETTTNVATATGVLSNGEVCTASDDAIVVVNESTDACADGKPSVLTMRYTGEDCSATHHSQDPSMVSCEGDPMGAEMVWIRASNKAKLDAKKVKVWFNGPVALGESFDIDSSVANASRLGGNTYFHIFDLEGKLLQKVSFHTSCSQPLNFGDQFGSLVLEDVMPEIRSHSSQHTEKINLKHGRKKHRR